ncbi:hypothetical protein RDV89_13340 [Nocardioides zeae]|uniref:Uncharacterized protein n=1 Tax=Nocardioides imazamoxiresistens TaxID=3231893 RepID=A0ABU3PY03_9ACTN|nr:hypothetical protein [Nocardioides zeae]MDT9594061.1 hypothetical protein [Nocardioides zeae]
MRAIVFEAEDAEALAARLRADGYAADVVRERLSGEDDDEDHPWAVVTDAPQALVELAVEEHDGWVDAGDGPGDGAAPRQVGVPLELPTAPRRIKRP